VRAHIFLCMLAYYVDWHLREAWRELNRSPYDGRHEARSVIHGRPVRSLATNRKPAGGG